MTKKVKEIVDRIESDFRELAEETKVNHISAFMIGGRFYIDDYDHLDDGRKSKFKVEGKEKTDE